MKKILVTGGAGFIGSHLCEKLLNKGNYVVCLDNLYTGSLDNIKSFSKNPSFKFVKGDIRNESIVAKLVKDADKIYHLAAIVGVAEVVRNPLDNITVNINGTYNIAKSAHKYGNKKIVFTSSSEVYGKNSSVPLTEEKSLSIFGPTTVTRWAYGMAKAVGEHILLGFAERGLPTVILRYFNSYGAGFFNQKYSNVIPLFILQSLKGKDITIHGDGKQTRCFCQVEDTVNATILAMEKSENEIINVGSDKEITINNLAKLIKKLTSSKSKIIHIKEKDVFKKQYESSRRRIPNIKKAKRLLGFTPKTTLENGLKETIQWIKEKNY